jgi:hypothetical protein
VQTTHGVLKYWLLVLDIFLAAAFKNYIQCSGRILFICTMYFGQWMGICSISPVEMLKYAMCGFGP